MRLENKCSSEFHFVAIINKVPADFSKKIILAEIGIFSFKFLNRFRILPAAENFLKKENQKTDSGVDRHVANLDELDIEQQVNDQTKRKNGGGNPERRDKFGFRNVFTTAKNRQRKARRRVNQQTRDRRDGDSRKK